MDARAERIYQAKRAGLVSRAAVRLGAARAAALVAGWEAEARERSLDRAGREFWDGAEAALAAALAARPRR